MCHVRPLPSILGLVGVSLRLDYLCADRLVRVLFFLSMCRDVSTDLARCHASKVHLNDARQVVGQVIEQDWKGEMQESQEADRHCSEQDKDVNSAVYTSKKEMENIPLRAMAKLTHGEQ